MKCTKCGSENLKVDVVNEIHYKKGHGCLFTILFGVYYWCWLLIKWTMKFFVAVTYWLTWAWISYIICYVNKSEWKKPKWYKKLMRVHGKNYNEQKAVAVCQDCGHLIKIK